MYTIVAFLSKKFKLIQLNVYNCNIFMSKETIKLKMDKGISIILFNIFKF